MVTRAAGSQPPDSYPLYSCDDHMDLRSFPRDLWTERLPARLRERAPQVRTHNGRDWWFFEGRPIEPWGPRGPLEPSPFTRAGVIDSVPNQRPSTPALRLEDMDRDGIQASVIYGPLFWLTTSDRELYLACTRAYNDWGLEFSATNPNRLAVLPRIPTTSCADAVEELVRVSKAGARGAQFAFIEAGRPIYTAAWEPLWQTVAEIGIPFSFHIGGGTHSHQPITGSWEIVATASVAPLQMDEGLAGMIFSGMLERYPSFLLVLGESGLGWLPYMLERMDQEFHKYAGKLQDYQLSELPSTLFRRQVIATYEDEPMSIRLIPFIGVDNVMWASDYPHADSTWPHSREAVDKQFAGMPAEIKRKVTHDTCKRIYRFA